MSLDVVAYRACGYETPLWAFPNTDDGRYNRAGVLPTQYLSLHPMTPWAELLAERLHAEGVSAFIAPSAALPGTFNLVLEPAVVIDYHVEPIDPEDWPTSLLAQNGRCPENLWEHVHFKASPTEHPGLAAWRGGDAPEFTQPAVTAATLSAA